MKVVIAAVALAGIASPVWVEARREDKGKGKPQDSPGAQVVITADNCVFLDGSGDCCVFATFSIEVTNEKNRIFECKYDDVPNDTGEVVTWNHENTDLYCCTGGGPGNKGLLTTDWVETITPSGEAHTTCKFLGGGTPCNEIYPDLNVCCRSG